MASLTILIPIALLLLGLAIAALFWAVRSGQFDDLDRAASDILFDENEPPQPPNPPATPPDQNDPPPP